MKQYIDKDNLDGWIKDNPYEPMSYDIFNAHTLAELNEGVIEKIEGLMLADIECKICKEHLNRAISILKGEK